MFSRVTNRGPRRLKPETEPRFINWARVRIGLTGRLLVLVSFAVVPALVIQAWNEYDLRIAREADIRQQSVLYACDGSARACRRKLLGRSGEPPENDSFRGALQI